ncbi:hypothetical protein ZWY2020_052264 [Hordeum vulgare]|nr:hypothetical protein ZWY2020_052264 [Hordeum vulgare]
MGSSHGYGGANKDEAPSKSPPSRLDVDDHPKNSLLPQEPDQGSSSECPKDCSDSSSSRSRSSGSHGRSAAHSANGGSFEFRMEERAAVAGLGPFLRQQVPSKWNACTPTPSSPGRPRPPCTATPASAEAACTSCRIVRRRRLQMPRRQSCPGRLLPHRRRSRR